MEYKYKAFISYNHNERDSRVARLLHNRIETYTVPRKLRKNGKKKPGKVFRDQEELSASSDLNQHIRDALDESEFLIVICSPGAVASRWVSKEIAYFLEHHKQERLLTVLTGGEENELFPALFPGLPEPLSMDLRQGYDLKSRFLKLCAPLMGCEYDELVMRDQKRRRRQMMWWMAGIAAVAAVIISILLWSYIRINAKNQEILLRESEMLTLESLEALDEGDWAASISYALSALPSVGNDRPYYAAAEQALLAAIAPLEYPARPQRLQNTVLSQNTAIDAYCINSDGSRLATVDESGFLTCFDTVTGQVQWTAKVDNVSAYTNRLIHYTPENTILLINESCLCAVAWESGKIIWNNDYEDGYTCTIASEDGSCLAVLYSGDGLPLWYSDCDRIDFLSPVNGSTNASADINIQGLGNLVMDETPLAFSSDGTTFAICDYRPNDDGSRTCTIINTQTGNMYSFIYPGKKYGRTNLRIQFMPDDTGMLFLHHTAGEEDIVWVELYDFSTQSFLWSTEIQGKSDNDYTYMSYETPFASFFPGRILICEDSELFILDIHSGEFLCSTETQDIVEDLVVLNDAVFGFVMLNGCYVLGYINDEYIRKTDWDAQTVYYELNTEGTYALWNGGFFQVSPNAEHFTVGSEKDGLGYAVVLSPDEMKLTIIRPYQPADDYGQVYGDAFDFLCGTEITPYGDDIIVGLFSRYREVGGDQFYCIVVDPDTMEVKQEIDVSANTHVHFLADGSGYLRWGDALEITHVDPVSGKETPVLDPSTHVCFSREGSDVITPAEMELTTRLTATDDYWTVAMTDVGIASWINGAQLTTVFYPDGIDLSDKDCPYDGYQEDILASGHLLVSFQKSDGDETITDRYLYDRTADAWYVWSDDYEQACALFHPWCAELGAEETIMIRDYTSGQIVTEIPCVLPKHIIDQVSFVLEDQYLLVTTEDNLIKLYDLTSTEEVFSYHYEYSFSNMNYICRADPQNDRIYLYTDEQAYYDIGMCIDSRSWTLLTEIDEMAYFDPKSGILFRSPFIPESGYHFIMGRLPATDELIAYGQDILAQQQFAP